ncbi:MAG: hypothetical protein PHU34_03560 [Candidatus Methanoperedens sp.]|nr:hypothetical protein [Candidatus Methanoperedens sp.]
MVQEKSNWVKGIEQDLTNYFYKKIVWTIILLLSIFVFYFSKNISLILGITGDNIIGFISLLLVFIALIGALDSPKHPDYLAYYLYQIGNELPEFELDDHYLKRNKKYIKNCSKQISNILGAGEGDLRAKYFTDNIVAFLDKLYIIILRLNHLYSREDIDEMLMNKLNGMSSEPFITEREFISSNLISLANIIHKESSSLTQSHVDIANKISEELKDISEKPFTKSLSEYVKEKWSKLHYNLKILIFLGIVFGTIFIILSQILMYYGIGQQSFTTAMLVSGALTAAAFSKIDLFIARERGR